MLIFPAYITESKYLHYRSILFLLFTLMPFAVLLPQDTGSDNLQQYIEMPLEEMMHMKITTAGKKEEAIEDIPASVIIITRRDIELYGYRTLDEILANVPGLYNIDDYSLIRSNYGVRGFWSGEFQNLLMMVNGVNQVYDITESASIRKTGLPVEAIERVEIVRGPMSVLYGSGAFYGVINIITKNSCDLGRNSINIAAGSKNTQKASVILSGWEGNIKFNFAAGLCKTDGIDAAINKLVRDVSKLAAYNISDTYNTAGKINSNDKYFLLSADYRKINVEMNYEDNSNNDFFIMPSPKKGNENFCISTRIAAGYTDTLSRMVIINGKAAYIHGRTRMRFNYLDDNFYGFQQHEANAYEFDASAILTFSPRLDVTAGIFQRTIFNAYNNYDLPSFGSASLVNNYYYLPDGEDITMRAVYGQMNWVISEKLRAVAGIRAEQMPKYKLAAVRAGGTPASVRLNGEFDKDEIQLIPRCALIYSPDHSHIVKFLYGKANIRPSFFQNSQNAYDPVHGNLKPEIIQTFELNYLGAFSSSVSLNVSVFRNQLTNLISRKVEYDQTGGYRSWASNWGCMNTNGVEMSASLRPAENLIFDGSFTIQKTKDDRAGYENIDVAYSPAYLGYVKLLWQASNSFSAAFTGNYVGAMEAFWDETILNPDNTRGSRIGDKAPGYFIAGLNVRMADFPFQGGYVNVRCSNLFNTEIRYPAYTNNQWADKGTIGEGLMLMISTGYNF